MNKKLLQEIIDYQGPAENLILATIIDSSGSSPRKAGSALIIYPDGTSSGTIGGGPIEGDTVERATEMFKDEKNTDKYNFELTNDQVAKEGGLCGGNVTVFVEKIGLKP